MPRSAYVGALRGRRSLCGNQQRVGCAVRNQHRHAIEQVAPMAWRTTISAQVAGKRGARRLPPAAVPGRRGVRAGATFKSEAAHALRARLGCDFLRRPAAQLCTQGEGGPAGPKTGPGRRRRLPLGMDLGFGKRFQWKAKSSRTTDEQMAQPLDALLILDPACPFAGDAHGHGHQI